MTDKPSKNIEELIRDGDDLLANGQFAEALEKYRAANEIDPDREGLCDKLIDAHEKAHGEEDWDMNDFAEHLDLVMHKQEHDYPPIKQIHAKLSPEWKEVSDLVIRILNEDDDETAGPMIEELVGRGEIAARALIDLLRTMKKGVPEGQEGEGV